MNQLVWAQLTMSPKLQAADPPSIGVIGFGAVSAVDELTREAGALEAWAGRLVAGSWMSPAAVVFANTAHQQVGRVRDVAALLGRLGEALRTLSAELASAKADAMDAIARSRQLDVAGDELNQTVSTYQVLNPLDPGSPPGTQAAAADIAAAQMAAAAALRAAENRAIDGWNRARFALDFISNATPARREQLANPKWDPSKNVLNSPSTAVSCGVMEALGLTANGVVIGPDQRAYRLVVGTAHDRDGNVVVSSREIPAKAGDWRQLAVIEGVTTFGRKASAADKWAVAVGGAAGAAYPEGSTFDRSRLKDIHIMADGGAYLADAEQVAGGSVKEASAEAQRGKGNEYWTAPKGGLGAGKTSTVPDGIGLFVNAVSSVLLATHLNDSLAARYRLVLEENLTGDRQARLELYRATNIPGQRAGVDVQAGYVDSAGQLAGTPVTGEDPDARAYAY